MLYPETISTILPSTGQNQHYGNVLLNDASVFIVKWLTMMEITDV